jgi:hypothetical protein
MLVIGAHLSAHTTWCTYPLPTDDYGEELVKLYVCNLILVLDGDLSLSTHNCLCIHFFTSKLILQTGKALPCLCQKFTLCYSGNCRYLSSTKHSSFSPCLCSGHVACITFFRPQQGYPLEQWLQEWPHKALSLYSTLFTLHNVDWLLMWMLTKKHMSVIL